VTPKTIIVPTDLGEGTEATLDYAVEISRAFGARLHLLHVVGIPVLGMPEMGIAYSDTMMDGMMADDLHALEHMIEARRGEADFDRPLIRSGDPRDAINETAKELHADLIVMATHGRRGVARVLLGSVTEMVVRTAPCPVLTMKSPEPTDVTPSAG